MVGVPGLRWSWLACESNDLILSVVPVVWAHVHTEIFTLLVHIPGFNVRFPHTNTVMPRQADKVQYSTHYSIVVQRK